MMAWAEYRSVPTVVRAFQWFTEMGAVEVIHEKDEAFAVYDGLHGSWINVRSGDWIIHGTKGEYYPCDPDVFATKYAPVTAAPTPEAVERVARWIKDRFYPRYVAWERLDDMTRAGLIEDARAALAALHEEA